MTQLRVPGGVSVPITIQNSDEGYYRAMDVIGVIMSPFQVVLNFIEFFQKLQEALEAVVDIVGDPASFTDKLQAVIVHVSKLLQYLPQLSVPVMIKDALITIDALLAVLLSRISVVENIVQKKEIAEIVAEDFPDMEYLVVEVDNQLTAATVEIAKMLEPLESVMSILNQFGSLINYTIEIPTIDASNISTIKSGVQDIRSWIQSTIAALGGV